MVASNGRVAPTYLLYAHLLCELYRWMDGVPTCRKDCKTYLDTVAGRISAMHNIRSSKGKRRGKYLKHTGLELTLARNIGLMSEDETGYVSFREDPNSFAPDDLAGLLRDASLEQRFSTDTLACSSPPSPPSPSHANESIEIQIEGVRVSGLPKDLRMLLKGIAR